eukprot:350413-Chlamydomonas_euryale.AAC.15
MDCISRCQDSTQSSIGAARRWIPSKIPAQALMWGARMCELAARKGIHTRHQRARAGERDGALHAAGGGGTPSLTALSSVTSLTSATAGQPMITVTLLFHTALSHCASTLRFHCTSYERVPFSAAMYNKKNFHRCMCP